MPAAPGPRRWPCWRRSCWPSARIWSGSAASPERAAPRNPRHVSTTAPGPDGVWGLAPALPARGRPPPGSAGRAPRRAGPGRPAAPVADEADQVPATCETSAAPRDGWWRTHGLPPIGKRCAGGAALHWADARPRLSASGSGPIPGHRPRGSARKAAPVEQSEHFRKPDPIEQPIDELPCLDPGAPSSRRATTRSTMLPHRHPRNPQQAAHRRPVRHLRQIRRRLFERRREHAAAIRPRHPLDLHPAPRARHPPRRILQPHRHPAPRQMPPHPRRSPVIPQRATERVPPPPDETGSRQRSLDPKR